MATSGIYSFLMSRDSIIKAALRLTTRYGSDDVIPAEDMTLCGEALNIICKEMVSKLLPLWCVQEVSIFLVAGQAAYDVSAASGLPRPMRVLQVFVRDSSGNDRNLEIVTRWDQGYLTQKSSPGSPNQCYYDPQLGAASLVLYNVPTASDVGSKLYVLLQRPVQDFNLATDNPDFPQEAYRMLKWNLADEISLEYSTPRDVRAEINAKAHTFRADFEAGVQDEVSVTFTPSGRSS